MDFIKDSEPVADDARTAAGTVFAITKLLEQVLADLDPRTLLLSQRVNTKWRTVINTNTQLQKHLFLLPSTLEDAMNWVAGADQTHLLVMKRPKHGNPSLEIETSLLNPLLFTQNGRGHAVVNYDKLCYGEHRKRKSLRQMLFMQPRRQHPAQINSGSLRSGFGRNFRLGVAGDILEEGKCARLGGGVIERRESSRSSGRTVLRLRGGVEIVTLATYLSAEAEKERSTANVSN